MVRFDGDAGPADRRDRLDDVRVKRALGQEFGAGKEVALPAEGVSWARIAVALVQDLAPAAVRISA